MLILTLFYVLSVLGAYLETRRMYREEFNTLEPNWGDFFIIFIPFYNFIMASVYLINVIDGKFRLKQRMPKGWLSKFFRV